MPDITREDVEHIARLARIKLRRPEGVGAPTGVSGLTDEVTKLTGELGSILTYVSKLNEIDTTGVEPTMFGQQPRRETVGAPTETSGVTRLENVFRKDPTSLDELRGAQWWEGNPHDLVEAAPSSDGEYVKVKGIMADK